MTNYAIWKVTIDFLPQNCFNSLVASDEQIRINPKSSRVNLFLVGPIVFITCRSRCKYWDILTSWIFAAASMPD